VQVAKQEHETLQQLAARITARAAARMYTLMHSYTIISMRSVAFEGCVHVVITAELDAMDADASSSDAADAGSIESRNSDASSRDRMSLSSASSLAGSSQQQQRAGTVLAAPHNHALLQQQVAADMELDFGSTATVSVYHLASEPASTELLEAEASALLEAATLPASAALCSSSARSMLLPRLLPCYLDPVAVPATARQAEQQQQHSYTLAIPGISSAAAAAAAAAAGDAQQRMVFTVIAQQGGRVLARSRLEVATLTGDQVHVALPAAGLQAGLLQLFLVSSSNSMVLASACALVLPSESCCAEVQGLKQTMLQEALASLMPAASSAASRATDAAEASLVQCLVHTRHLTPFAMDLARLLEMAATVHAGHALMLPRHAAAGTMGAAAQQSLSLAAASLFKFCVNMELWETAELVRGCISCLALEVPSMAAEPPAGLMQVTAQQGLLQEQQHMPASELVRHQALLGGAGMAEPLAAPAAPGLSMQHTQQAAEALAAAAAARPLVASAAALEATEVAQDAPARVLARAGAKDSNQQAMDDSSTVLHQLTSSHAQPAAPSRPATPATVPAPADEAGMHTRKLGTKAGAWVDSMLAANTIPDVVLALQSAGLRQHLRKLPVTWSTALHGFQPQQLEMHYVRWRLAHSTPFDMAALAASLCRSSLLMHVGLAWMGPASGAAVLMASLELVLVLLQLAMLWVRRNVAHYYWLQQKLLTGVILAVSCVLLAVDGRRCPGVQSLAAVWKVAFVQRFIMPHGQVRGSTGAVHAVHVLPHALHVPRTAAGRGIAAACTLCRCVPGVRTHACCTAVAMRCHYCTGLLFICSHDSRLHVSTLATQLLRHTLLAERLVHYCPVACPCIGIAQPDTLPAFRNQPDSTPGARVCAGIRHACRGAAAADAGGASVPAQFHHLRSHARRPGLAGCSAPGTGAQLLCHGGVAGSGCAGPQALHQGTPVSADVSCCTPPALLLQPAPRGGGGAGGGVLTGQGSGWRHAAGTASCGAPVALGTRG
jgi:hypothetical protein